MSRRQATAQVASALVLLGGMPLLVGCPIGRQALEQMCIQQCEREGQRFEDMERCRAECRDAHDARPSPG